MRRTALLAGAALVAAGCGSSAAPAAPPAGPAVISRGVAAREPAVSPAPYGAADLSFGLGVLGAWCRARPGSNIVLSPESLATGLGMAYLGARGSTARVMARVLHLPVTGNRLLAGLQARADRLAQLAGPGVALDRSDQVWADPGLRTLRGYLDDVATGYGAAVRRVPLLSNPGGAVQQINAAVAAATRGHIPHLLAPGSVRGIGWMLTDALYLDAAWATPFQAARTGPAPFTTAAGRQVTARYLRGGGFRYVRSGGWTALSLPYRGGQLAMIALLPPVGSAGCVAPHASGLRRIEGSLAGPGARAAIALPKVSLSSQASMRSVLTRLGMGQAFGPRADFSGLSPQAGSLGVVIHAATLQVAERGTVGSAATAVGVGATAIQYLPHPIAFNRPYLMLVTDVSTGEPLFLARVANPSTG